MNPLPYRVLQFTSPVLSFDLNREIQHRKTIIQYRKIRSQNPLFPSKAPLSLSLGTSYFLFLKKNISLIGKKFTNTKIDSPAVEGLKHLSQRKI